MHFIAMSSDGFGDFGDFGDDVPFFLVAQVAHATQHNIFGRLSKSKYKLAKIFVARHQHPMIGVRKIEYFVIENILRYLGDVHDCVTI